MAVTDASVVDGMGTDKVTGEIVLTISDHLDWADESGHLNTLQIKLNSYLDFIGSGQLYEDGYATSATPVRIDIIGKFPVPDTVAWFFQKAAEGAAANRTQLIYRQLPDGY